MKLRRAALGAPLLLALPVPAMAAAPPSVAAASDFQYVTGGAGSPVPLRVVAGGSLVFVNGDVLAPHTLTARLPGDHDGARFSTGTTEVQFGEARPVAGVEDLTPGTYEFFCQLHSWFMTGELQVVAP